MLSSQPIVSARLKHIVTVSSSVRQSHLKQMVESYHMLILTSRCRHRILRSVGCKGYLMITCSGNRKPEKRISVSRKQSYSMTLQLLPRATTGDLFTVGAAC